MERVRGFLKEIKIEQATAPAWRTFAERAGFLLRDAFSGWRLPFILAFAVGLAVGGPVAWFAMGSAFLLVGAYVTQAHTRDWTIYYLEVFPAIAFVAAVGAKRIVRDIRRRAGASSETPLAPLAVGAFGVAALLLIVNDTIAARGTLGQLGARTRDFRAGVAQLAAKPNVVFVRYAERRNMHISLVANDGMLQRSPSWIVHDRGADNLRLMRSAPERAAFLYDEATNVFTRMVP
jgi:hypothetical protein